MAEASASSSILALDVGEVRIGVARAGSVARIAEPLTTLVNSPEIFHEIARLCQDHQVKLIVVGLPRGLSGQTTRQTASATKFAKELKRHLKINVVLQDEALTSHQAIKELTSLGKKFNKADIDALAATYILDDYLQEHGDEI